ncbi:MAG: glycosyltransferase family 4 protein [Myxococcales bacterium]|nr:glycosyltransferase family 4 protein [Myxococcales bacterium]
MNRQAEERSRKKRRRPHVLLMVTSPLSSGFLVGLTREFLALGVEVTVAMGHGQPLTALPAGVAVERLPFQREIAGLGDVLALVATVRLLSRIRPDLVDVSTPKAGFIGGLAAWLCRTDCRIYTLRGLRLETASGLKGAVLFAAERVACGAAHRVICVSRSLRDAAVRWGVLSEEKAVVLGSGSSSGVEVERYAPTDERKQRGQALRARLGIPPEATVIGFVGRFTKDKGIAELSDAFGRLQEELPRLWLLLVGEFEKGDPVPASTRRFIESNTRVVRAGFVDDPADYYAAMELLVLPTYREGFPNTVLEAQAAGLPVVTTSATGAVDSVADGVTGLLVPAARVDPLVIAIRRLASDRAEAVRMGLAGQARVMREFRREVVCRNLARYYCQLISERQRPTAPGA